MKILIADDHDLFREGMRHVLAQLQDGVVVVEAGDYVTVLDQVATHGDLGLILLDLQMPGKDGFAVLDYFSKHYPMLPVVVLSGSENRADMQRSLDCGAMGFIQKSENAAVMLNALRLVLSGGIYVPPAMVQSGNSGSDCAARDTLGITPRQLEVLARIVEGEPNKVIAAELGLSIATVKAHITATFKALKVSNRTQAVRAVERLGIKLPG